MQRRNIIVIGKNEEIMQGIIRGIEALDANNQISIIHGITDSFYAEDEEPTKITEPLCILADLTESILVMDAECTFLKYHPDKVKDVYLIPLLSEYTTRDEVIEHIKKFPHLIQDLLNT